MELRAFVLREVQAGKTVLPAPEHTFSAFHACPWRKLRVVILGDKPYGFREHDHGLAFSTRHPRPTMAMENIVKAIWEDTKLELQEIHPGRKIRLWDVSPENMFATYDLTQWASQGILLLNVLLSCTLNEPLAHKKKGWEQFIAETITMISRQKEHVVFMLWGDAARYFKRYIAWRDRHLIIEAAHPALADPKAWDGMRSFSTCNKQLRKWNSRMPVIGWGLWKE